MTEIKNICFSYGKHVILKNICADVADGECVAVLGNNGAGKSTFITCLDRINTPSRGEVLIDGRDVLKMSRADAAKTVSYVAQRNELTHTTVFDAVLLGRKPYIKWTLSQEDVDICDETIQRLGLSEFSLRYVNELSGGELQKVMLARALVQQPRLLLLDEPTSCLDPKNQHEMLSIVRQAAKERGFGVLIVIHDLNLAIRYCDRFLFLKDGEVFRFGDESVITDGMLYEVYGVRASVACLEGRRIVVVR